MKKTVIAFSIVMLLSMNALALIELSDSCVNGIKSNMNNIKNQAAEIIVNSNSGGRIQYAAYLLHISAKYVLGMEQMQDSELSDVASICEIKFDIKKLVESSRN